MRHKYFEITNFKGIEHIKLEFDSKPNSRVYTLVGLNESGKTTILEAMDFFESRTQNVDPLNLHGHSTVTDVHKLIPISRRSNFNDKITIEVGYVLEDEDKKRITKYLLSELGFEVLKPIPSDFTVEKSYRFSNSIVIEKNPESIYSLQVWGKSKRGKNAKYIDGDKWKSMIAFLKNMMPSVLYFPNLLFEFPDRIYLENPPPKEDAKKHRFYREVLEDVLHAIDENASVEDHILARVKGETSWADWFSETLESTLSKMGSHISRTVFTQWNKILNSEAKGKEITLRAFREPLEEGAEANFRVYLQLRLKEGSEYYSIGERSLGFRWFFAFLLFTQYRGFRGGDIKKNILFLFDEPASNLHSSAQSQLLDSFGKFPENSSFIYTTHSHHLINPAWLEGAFVVKNAGLTYDGKDDEFNAANTRITLHKYREFVASHPDQTTYFQPILDVLDYRPSQLEKVPNVVMLEGKNDFYTLKYLTELLINKKLKFNLLPGGGSGSLDSAIQLYIAWGRNFVVLLDSDEAGRDQKARYENKFGSLVKNKVFALSDIDAKWKKITTEGLFTDAEKNRIQKSAYPGASGFNKTHFNRAIQEAYLTGNKLTLSKGTMAKFQKIVDFCSEKLKV
jgi:predicted ATP-dependent endonuclease of OLD family